MDDTTIQYCEERQRGLDGIRRPHGWYILECPKCLERRLVEELDTLREESKQKIADLEAQAEDMEKQLKERIDYRG